MLVPALIPLCVGHSVSGGGALLVSLLVVLVHSSATLLVTGAVAIVVYEWVGVAFLRRGWISFDMLWTGMLACTGLLLMAA